jgi:MFS family permease
MDKSIITSSTSLFALIISPFSSVLADRLGRKHVILYADILFIAGALLQAWSSTVPIMVAGRCIIGAGVGAASFVVPLYIAEVAPAAHRGRLVTLNIMFITLGQVIAYIVGWAFSTYGSPATGWRWMVGLGALPAILQGGMIAFMPETPRWLVKVGRSNMAKEVIRRVNGDTLHHNADAVIKEIELEVREEHEAERLRDHQASGRWEWLGGWRVLISEGRNRRALAIACLLQGLQQLCGFVSDQKDYACYMANFIAEFTNVLLCNHLYSYWLPKPYAYLNGSCGHELPRHCCCVGTCRSHRSKEGASILDTVYGCWSVAVGIRLLVPFVGNGNQHNSRRTPRHSRTRNGGPHHPCEYHGIRRSVRAGSR